MNRDEMMASSPLRRLLDRVFHRHEWIDLYVFNSVIQGRRVLGQAVMMGCAGCPAVKRRHLPTWREARLARKLIQSRARAASTPSLNAEIAGMNQGDSL